MKSIYTKFRCIATAMGMAMTAAATGAAGQCDPGDLFGPSQGYSTGLVPNSVAIGDFDGDGTPDLAVGSNASESVSVLLGNGDGTFQTRQDFATGVGVFPRSVAIGDFDGDGTPDLAFTNFFSNTVSVLLGNGNGTFQTRQDLATGIEPFSVAIGDLNRDGVPDLVVPNAGSNTVSVRLGNGNGTFQSRQDFATGSRPQSVAIGDLDGDGAPDLAVANQDSSSVSVLLNQCATVLPVINQQPMSVVAGPTPQLVSFSVTATSATTPTYLWLRDGESLSDDAEITGTGTPTLTIFAHAEDVAAYRCVVSNADGEVTSMPAVLGFRPNPCPADYLQNGTVNVFDILAFLQDWEFGCP